VARVGAHVAIAVPDTAAATAAAPAAAASGHGAVKPSGQAHAHTHSHAHAHGDLNMRGVFLHVLGDALGSIAVMLSAGISLLVRDPTTSASPAWVQYVDPGVSLLITCLLLAGAVPLVTAAARILLQVAPPGVDVADVERRIKSVKGVRGVHDLHVWQLDGNRTVASVHVAVADDEYDEEGAGDGAEHSSVKSAFASVVRDIRRVMHEAAGVHSVTVMPETVARGGHETAATCVFRCAKDTCGEGVQCCK